MAGRATGILKHSMLESVFHQVQVIDECIDEADWVIVADIFIQRLGEEEKLIAVAAVDIVH